MLEISSLSKAFTESDKRGRERVQAVDNVSLKVEQGKLFTA